MKASFRGSLGRDPQSALQLAHFVHRAGADRVIGTGPAGHALARPCAPNVTTAGTLRSGRVVRRDGSSRLRSPRTPAAHERFRHQLIRTRLPRPGRRRRASRVPILSVRARAPPTPPRPGCVYLRTEAPQAWPSPRHDRLGSRVVNLSRLQASRGAPSPAKTAR